eukprot:CAMPEP_0173437358 /NCGR_PEP_ID=MMETSP1357-20121228/17986_1 /TAXON_ID=77926 /ORGANISM="Hemiselmis rufescens, Strain PCC563" /LENGTH=418 /DNA_ID=CAMNT_0014402535 /DNA_START=74 /DNA_END=1330 /DNA_ORIENTATION=-
MAVLVAQAAAFSLPTAVPRPAPSALRPAPALLGGCVMCDSKPPMPPQQPPLDRRGLLVGSAKALLLPSLASLVSPASAFSLPPALSGLLGPPPDDGLRDTHALDVARMQGSLDKRRMEREERGETRKSEGVRKEIWGLVDDDSELAPLFLRLSFHTSGTYDQKTRTGGSQKGSIHYGKELNQADNAGLAQAVQLLDDIQKRHPEYSRADIYTLAGVHAVEMMGGPVVPWRSGRVDAKSNKEAIPEGRLPQPDKGTLPKTADHVREVFGRMGLNDKDMAALIGAHTCGGAHKQFSGYEGRWTPTDIRFDNLYYVFLTKKNLKYELGNVQTAPEGLEWTGLGKKQFDVYYMNDVFFMLPVDMVFKEDPKFRPYIDAYAKDQDVWFKDFSEAYGKLLELGTKDLRDDVVVAGVKGSFKTPQ